MSKPARGTKRACPSCGARFYDLNKSPITCPVCQTVFQTTPTRRGERAAPVEARKEEDEEIDTPVMPGVEVVSLEDAEAPDVADEEDIDLGEDAEDIPSGDDEDDTFLEEEEEDGEPDVKGIVGGPGKGEEA